MAKYKSHIRVSTAFMDDEFCNLSRNAQLIYIWYMKYRSKDGIARPPQSLLMKKTHLDRGSVSLAIKELKSVELLKPVKDKQSIDVKNCKYGVIAYYVYDSMSSNTIKEL